MSDNVIATEINNLLELLKDSHDGYNESSQVIDDLQMKDLFNRLAALRTRMISELKSAVMGVGITSDVTGSMLAAGHRLFLELKALVTNGDVAAIVTEIKRGENFTIDKFKEVLKLDLPDNLRQLLQRHLSEIEVNLKTVEVSAKV